MSEDDSSAGRAREAARVLGVTAPEGDEVPLIGVLKGWVEGAAR